MPDIFDTLAPEQQQSGDIFDQITDEPKGDIFDHVAEQSQPSATPETDKALNQSREAMRPRVEWDDLKQNHPRIYGFLEALSGIIPRSIEDVKSMVTLPMPSHDVEKERQASEQWGAAVRGEHGPAEQTKVITGTALQALPLAHLAFPDVPSPIRTEPLVPEVPPTVSLGPGTTAADVTRAMQGPGWERRFQMVEEQPPTLAPVQGVEETARAAAERPPRVSPETGFEFYPTGEGERLPVTSETARIGGESDAIQRSNAQIQAGETPLGIETRPEGGIPSPGDRDYVKREAQGKAGELPQEQPVPAGESVAPATSEEPNAPRSLEADLSAPAGGPSIRAVSERPIETSPPGTVRGWEEATAHGENWLNKGGDINKVVTDFRKTGKVNELEMGKMNAYLNRLQSVTNQTGDALRDSPNDPKLQKAHQQAVAAEQAFTNAYKPMHTVASGSLSALQGHVPLTEEAASSFTGLTRRFSEFQGKPMEPEQVVKADRISKKMQKANSDYAKSNGEVYRQIDNEYGRIRTTRKGPPSIEDLGKIFGETLDEVCDV